MPFKKEYVYQALTFIAVLVAYRQIAPTLGLPNA